MAARVNPRLLALLSCAALLSACASANRYPSLGMRDAERATGTLQPAEAEPYVPPATPAETLDRIGRLSAEAQAAHQAFLAAAEHARPLASGAHAAEGSDAWSKAQIALADVEAARSQTMIALAELDRLYVDAEMEGLELDRIAAARDAVSALVDSENEAIDSLRGGA